MKNWSKTTSTTVTITDADSVFNEIVNISTRTAKGVLEIGKLILQFEDSIIIKASGSNQLEDKLVNEKVMAASTISSYRTIGGCAELARYIDLLPPFFNHMYVLAKQEKKQPGFIRMKVESGELDRTTTLATIREWSAPASKAKGEKMERNGRLMLRLYVDEGSVDVVTTQLENMVANGFQIEVDYSELQSMMDRQAKETMHDAYRSIYKYLKDFEKSMVKQLRNGKFNAKGAKEEFKLKFPEVADFLAANTMGNVVTGLVSSDQLNEVLAHTGTDKAVNDFYFETPVAA